jgi:dolichol-phosphate mannosyltransferase
VIKLRKCFIVLPCYNEENNIEQLILRIDKVLSTFFSYQIIAVDDGSIDKTGMILNKLSKRYPITLITHTTNLGLSAALQDGLNMALQQASDEDVIITMDADNTHDPQYIIKMMDYINKDGADVVIASRYISDGRQINVPLYRVILSRCTNLFLRLITGIPANDITSGYRAFKALTIKKVANQLKGDFVTSKGFEVAVEILAKIYWYGGNNIKIIEMPFVLDYSVKKGKSKLKIIPTARLYLSLLRKIKIWKTNSVAVRKL